MSHNPSYEELAHQLRHFEREHAERLRVEAGLENELRKFRTLYDLATAMTGDRRLEQNLQLAVDRCRELLCTDTANIMRLEQESGDLVMQTCAGIRDPRFGQLRVPAGKGLGGLVTRSGRGFIVKNYANEDQFEPLGDELIQAEGLVSGMAAPIQMGRRVLGVFYAFNRSMSYFAQPDLDTLSLIGNLVALEISRKEARGQLRRAGEELEGRVAARTAALMAVNQRLEAEISERRRVETALRESEERYRQIFKTSAVSIWEEDFAAVRAAIDAVVDRIGREAFADFLAVHPEFVRKAASLVRVLEVNDATLALYHAEGKDQLLGSLDKVLAPASFDALRDLLLAIAQRRPSFEGEAVNRTLAGEEIQILMQVSIPREKSRFSHLIVCISDITERKRALAALWDSEERFRTAFETSPDAITINRGVDGRYIDVNDGFTALTGYGREEVLGHTAGDIQIWADPGDRRRLAAGLRRQGYVKNLKARFRYKDGSCRTGLISANRISLGGQPHTLTVGREIEDLLSAEQALAESEKKYRLLVENANDAIFVVQDNVIRYANPTTQRLSGYSAAELAQLPLSAVLRTEETAPEEAALQEGSGAQRFFSAQMTTRSGGALWLHLNTVPITWEGKPANLQLGRDVTRQRHLEDHIRQVQKMEAMATLAGGIAHDFNNLLMGIQGNISLILLTTDPQQSAYPKLKKIETYIENAAELTRQLLGMTRGGKYEVRPGDVNAVLAKTVRLFGRTCKEIQIAVDCQENLWASEVDQGQIQQALLNIFVNAAQAMPQGGDMRIETRNVELDEDFIRPHHLPAGRYVRVSISDTGTGMEEAIRQRIFDPFFTTKEIGRGTGLGLASVYGIISNHGGFIQVQSQKGQGSTFTLYLPAHQPGAGAAPAARSERAPGGAETVLLVDDEAMITEVGRAMLEKMGYSVLTAGSGVEALEVFGRQRDRIRLVVLDMIMPEMSGGETFDRLREISPRVKVLLSSGYSLDERALGILQRGCSGFIQKPFDMKRLGAKVREILDTACA
ncbi:MAG: PAS domain S-box protein [Desulfobacteraceae bacterium]|nr:PAS domain S-box protein [Desulfobacteraceae bacterium]